MSDAPLTVITGANRGIGLALATRLAAQNPVIGTHRSAAPDVAGIDWRALDVTDPAGVDAFAAALDRRPIGLLVCNAGVYLDRGQPLTDGYAPQLWADTFAANVTGVFLTIQALLPNVAAGKGRIAIISSRMGSQGHAKGQSYIYRASKAAALNLGRNLAIDLAPQEIPVGIYHPGWVQTDMGGAAADLTVDQSADGLVARFAELTMERSGHFLNYDGTALPH